MPSVALHVKVIGQSRELRCMYTSMLADNVYIFLPARHVLASNPGLPHIFFCSCGKKLLDGLGLRLGMCLHGWSLDCLFIVSVCPLTLIQENIIFELSADSRPPIHPLRVRARARVRVGKG